MTIERGARESAVSRAQLWMDDTMMLFSECPGKLAFSGQKVQEKVLHCSVQFQPRGGGQTQRPQSLQSRPSTVAGG